MIVNAWSAIMHHLRSSCMSPRDQLAHPQPCPVPCLRVPRHRCSAGHRLRSTVTSSMAAVTCVLVLACALLMPFATASSKGCERAEQQCQAACSASAGVRSFSCAAKGTRYQCVCQVTS